MKFKVICHEDVTTEFLVEAPNKERVEEWLDTHGAVAVSALTKRQTVHERSYLTMEANTKSPIDFNTEEGKA